MKKYLHNLGLLVFLLLVLPFHFVFAHATPLEYVPAASSVLEKAPEKVVINFSEHIEPKASSITVFAPNGDQEQTGEANVNAADSRSLSIPVADKGRGTYTVSWQVISADDGHFTKGAYVFSVGARTTGVLEDSSAQFAITHTSPIVESLTISIELLGAAFLLGALFVLMFVWRKLRQTGWLSERTELEIKIRRRFLWFTTVSVLLVLVGGIWFLLYKAADLQSLQHISYVAALRIFSGTLAGRYTLYRLALSILFFLILWFKKDVLWNSEKISISGIVLIALLALTDLLRARVSHAAASEFHPIISIILNFIHLFFKDAWVGSVVALLVLLGPIVNHYSDKRITAFVLNAFSFITNMAFIIAGITGVYVVWLHLKDPTNVLSSDWGQLFIVLSIFGALLFVARIINQIIIGPQLIKEKPSSLVSWLPITLTFEAGIAIAVLVVTGLLIITTPPITQKQSYTQTKFSQGLNITLSDDPFHAHQLLITLTDSEKKAPSLSNIVVSLTNQKESIGPIIASTQKIFLGGYLISEDQIAPAGEWHVAVTASRDGSYDSNADFTLNYPHDIEVAQAYAAGRHLNSFAYINIAIAIAVLLLGLMLIRFTNQQHKKILAAASAPLPLPLYARGLWTLPLFTFTIIIFFIGGIHNHNGNGSALQSAFQTACTKNGFMWHDSVPETNGQATSDVAVNGCMVGMGLGQYHFGDMREYQYFVRPTEATSELKFNSKAPIAGQPENFQISILDDNRNPVTDLVLDHDRLLHVIIIPQDFNSYAHIHTEDIGPVTQAMKDSATFPLTYTFPKAGRYLVAVDYSVRSKIFSDKTYITVAGTPEAGTPQDNFSLHQMFDGYDVVLSSTDKLNAGKQIVLNYRIEKNNQPVTDLEPYLLVPMHIGVVREDLLSFMHIHGVLPPTVSEKLFGASPANSMARMMEVTPTFGPNIQTEVTFPTAGIYHIFGQFNHKGKIVLTHFVVKVE